MKLNKNKTNIIILLILISFITSEPIKVIYGKFENIKHQKITLRLNDKLTICKNSKEINDVEMNMYYNNLKSINGDDSACKYYIAVKTGKFELFFENKLKDSYNYNDRYDYSIPTLLKGFGEIIFSKNKNYKTWDIVVSE